MSIGGDVWSVGMFRIVSICSVYHALFREVNCFLGWGDGWVDIGRKVLLVFFGVGLVLP